MTDDDINLKISEARGFATLGEFVAAWNLIDELPADERARLDALAVRVVVCTGLERWEMGVEIARALRSSLELPQREAAGQFHLAHAEWLCATGDVQGAKNSVRALSFIWPEDRELALNSRTLAAVW